MEIKYKDMVKAFSTLEAERNIPEEVIKEALCEAMAKAYKKESELSDIDVYAVINEKKKTIDLFQNYVVKEEVEDDELEISLEDAKKIDLSAEYGSIVSRPIEITSFSRASATLTKNVMRQKIREAEKVAVYEEYIDQKDEMVIGTVESVKDKFTLINLGKTVAMMPKSQEIPNERLVENQQIRVVIIDVKKETKGSQVLVSRSCETLVKRLFEKEVPEIYNGVVEIKAIARDPGERTKMAVVSHNPDVDPIGACIGPRGQRVQNIINELKGEKIDIFQWNDDITELVRNALAPAEVEAVLPSLDDRGLIVVVDKDQLSLAIGKKGKNARLAVKLTNDRKIDIKTREDLENAGVDYEELLAKAEEKKAEYREEAERKEAARFEAAAKLDEEKRLAKLEELQAKLAENNDSVVPEEDGFIPEEMQDEVTEKLMTNIAMQSDDNVNDESAEEVSDVVETTEDVIEEVAEEDVIVEEDAVEIIEDEVVEEVVKTPAKRKHADLEQMAENNTYVSRFEKLTDVSKSKNDNKPKRRKKKTDTEENFNVDNKELEKQIKERLGNVETKPLYSEEELEEIERQRQAEEERELGYGDEYDEEYDEYDDYYEDEEN